MSPNSELLVMEQALQKGLMLHLVGDAQAYFWLSTGWCQLQYAYEEDPTTPHPDYNKLDIKYIVALIAAWYKSVDLGVKDSGAEIDDFWRGLRSHKDYDSLPKKVVTTLAECAYYRFVQQRSYSRAIKVLNHLHELKHWDANKCHQKLFLLSVQAGRDMTTVDYENYDEENIKQLSSMLVTLSDLMSLFQKEIVTTQHLESEQSKASV